MVVLTLLAGLGTAFVGVVLVALLVVLVLRCFGFSGTGPVLGSYATRLQSKIGNVVAGSLFAIAQSIAMRRNVRIAALLGGVVVLGVVLAKLLGPVPGSPAVGLQAWTGNVVARSLFAIAQSIAMRRNVRIAALLGGVVVLGGASSVLALPLGLVPGSPAAGLQAWTGNIVAGSLFAIAQSVAMRRTVRIAALLGGVVVLGGAFPVLALLLGPVPGSPAIGLQAWTGNVVARSLFAIAQSIAMGGAVGITFLVSAVGRAVVGVSRGVVTALASL